MYAYTSLCIYAIYICMHRYIPSASLSVDLISLQKFCLSSAELHSPGLHPLQPGDVRSRPKSVFLLLAHLLMSFKYQLVRLFQ